MNRAARIVLIQIIAMERSASRKNQHQCRILLFSRSPNKKDKQFCFDSSVYANSVVCCFAAVSKLRVGLTFTICRCTEGCSIYHLLKWTAMTALTTVAMCIGVKPMSHSMNTHASQKVGPKTSSSSLIFII